MKEGKTERMEVLPVMLGYKKRNENAPDSQQEEIVSTTQTT
jgi:hypothetical protein